MNQRHCSFSRLFLLEEEIDLDTFHQYCIDNGYDNSPTYYGANPEASVRGGSYNDESGKCRSGYREGIHYESHESYLGFRIVYYDPR